MSASIRNFMREAALLTSAGSGVWATYSSVDSTNCLARRVAQRASGGDWASPAVFLAWHQLEGRGQHGRRWLCGPGEGVLATVLIRLRKQEELGILPLLAGVALAEELETIIAKGVRIRWPNDLYVRDAKIGGILVESMSRGASAWAAVGFGLNYGLEPPRIESRPTTSLTLEADDVPSLARTGVRFAKALVDALSSLSDVPGIVARAEELSSHQIGAEVRVRSGLQEVNGRYVGLDPRGFLLLETAEGLQPVPAGEIVPG